MRMRICTSHEMRKLDEIADQEYGIEAAILIENAGRAAAQVILEEYPTAGKDTEILVFAGKGNNAGDAFAVARRLICLERKVRIFHLNTSDGYRGPVLKNFEILQRMKAKMTQLESAADLQEFLNSSQGPYTMIDGILGTGLRGQLEGIYYEVVELINKTEAREVISLDIPSGVSGDTGNIHGTSVHSDLTISFGFPKMGHFLPPGAARRGSLINVDISLPPKFRKEGDKFLLMKSAMGHLLKERDRYGHKNAFGHTLLIGGSPGRLGAIVMSAGSCHRVGTGLVTVAGWDDIYENLMLKLPNETMAFSLHTSGPEYQNYKKTLPTYSSVVIGPGFGMRPEGKQILSDLLLHYDGPVVIDADALNLISEFHLHEQIAKRRAPTVLTPHPGEMARLLDWEKDDVTADPVKAVREAVTKTHATVLLKGAATLISNPDEVVYVNHYPNDGMATAGSGDVLAGIIGGLIGQRMDPFQGTLLGVYLHSLAGDFAARALGHRSMTAQDITENISNAFKDIKNTPAPNTPVEVRARLR
jgi:hydroxyethylthiazole kinase-like uncharacterized protein yjeF